MAAPFLNRTRYDVYNIETASIIRTDKKGSYDVLINGVVVAYCRVVDEQTGDLYYLLKGITKTGDEFERLVPAHRLTSREIESILANTGLLVMEAGHTAKFLKLTASELDPKRTTKTLVSHLGWFADAQGFFDGTAVMVSADTPREDFYAKENTKTPAKQRGTLGEWWQKIGRHIEANPILLGVALLALASLLLPRLGLASRIFNFFGGKGLGKTLALQTAATLFGNGADPATAAHPSDLPFVHKFETTLNGIEELLSSLAPYPAMLDELTEQAAFTLPVLMYKIASGGGKHRLSRNGTALPQHRWCQTVITSSEVSIAEAARTTGKPLLGGQADRGVDIPIEKIGVLTDFGLFGDFSALTRHLKVACGRFYGTPAAAFVRYMLEEGQATQDVLGVFEDVERELTPAGCGPGEARVVKHFAAAVLAGCLAKSAGVFRCDEDTIWHAVRLLVELWWEARAGALQLIDQYLVGNLERVVRSAPSLSNHSAAAFIHDGAVIIPRENFHHEFGDEAKVLLDELASLGALKGDQQGRRTRRFCNNRLWAYVIPLDRLPLVNDTDNIDGEAA